MIYSIVIDASNSSNKRRQAPLHQQCRISIATLEYQQALVQSDILAKSKAKEFRLTAVFILMLTPGSRKTI